MKKTEFNFSKSILTSEVFSRLIQFLTDHTDAIRLITSNNYTKNHRIHFMTNFYFLPFKVSHKIENKNKMIVATHRREVVSTSF